MLTKKDPSLLNRRMKRELFKLGYKDATNIPLSKCSSKLFYLITRHHDRVMNGTPLGNIRNRRC